MANIDVVCNQKARSPYLISRDRAMTYTNINSKSPLTSNLPVTNRKHLLK